MTKLEYTPDTINYPISTEDFKIQILFRQLNIDENSITHKEKLDIINSNEATFIFCIQDQNADQRELEVGELAISNHRILACVDLMNDDTVSYSSERTVKKTEVDYIGVIICTYIVRSSKEDESTMINVFYYHTKSKQLIDIKALKFKTNDTYLDSALFVLKNLNCIKFSNYTVKEAGSDLMLKYVFK